MNWAHQYYDFDRLDDSTDNNHVLRNLEALTNDPDTLYDPHLQLLVEAGIGLAIEIPYNIDNDQGLVVFGYRHSIDINRLQSSTHMKFLRKSVSFLGSINSYRGDYHIAKSERKREARAGLKILSSVLTPNIDTVES